MPAKNGGVVLDAEADLHNRWCRHDNVLERRRECFSEGGAADHCITVDAVIAYALSGTGEETCIGSLRKRSRITVNSQTLAVRDARLRIVELPRLCSSLLEKVLYGHALGGEFCG